MTIYAIFNLYCLKYISDKKLLCCQKNALHDAVATQDAKVHDIFNELAGILLKLRR